LVSKVINQNTCSSAIVTLAEIAVESKGLIELIASVGHLVGKLGNAHALHDFTAVDFFDFNAGKRFMRCAAFVSNLRTKSIDSGIACHWCPSR
jgi:hypothetical protein